MPTFIFAVLAALWPAVLVAQSCTLITISPLDGTGAVSGYVLDGQPLCYFLDRTEVSGEAWLLTDNACLVAPGLDDCSRSYRFRAGAQGLTLFVHQDQLGAAHAYFTLQMALD